MMDEPECIRRTCVDCRAPFAIFAEEAALVKVTATVDALFVLLQKSFRP